MAAAITTFTIVVVVCFAIGLLIAAIFLRLACKICREAVPGFGKAMGIEFVKFLAQGVVGFVLGLLLDAAGFAEIARMAVSGILSLPSGFLICAGLNTAMLPVRFVKALAISTLEYVFGIGLAVVVVGMLLVLAAVVS